MKVGPLPFLCSSERDSREFHFELKSEAFLQTMVELEFWEGRREIVREREREKEGEREREREVTDL